MPPTVKAYGLSMLPRSSTVRPSSSRRAWSTWAANEPPTVVSRVIRTRSFTPSTGSWYGGVDRNDHRGSPVSGSDGSHWAVHSVCGTSDLRPRERVRRHLHPPGATAPEPRRGGPLPLPPGGLLGALVQCVPGERRPPVPRRGRPPRVRDARVRLHLRRGGARQGGGADPRAPPHVGHSAAAGGRHPG